MGIWKFAAGHLSYESSKTKGSSLNDADVWDDREARLEAVSDRILCSRSWIVSCSSDTSSSPCEYERRSSSCVFCITRTCCSSLSVSCLLRSRNALCDARFCARRRTSCAESSGCSSNGAGLGTWRRSWSLLLFMLSSFDKIGLL